MFFDLLGSALFIGCFFLFTYRRELEPVDLDPFDVPELIEVHGPEREYLIVFLDFPVETEPI